MNNLIFVAKYIGLECLRYHLDNFKDDNNYIVVCNPDKYEIIHYLECNNIPYKDVDSFTSRDLEDKQFDWLLNLWGGYIFKKDILCLVENSLNIHPSYLPYGRGRDPVVWAIRYGWPAGVTLHTINEYVDEGDIWYQEEVPYTLPITGGDLYQAVVKACTRIFKEKWPNIRNLHHQKVPQQCKKLPTKKRKDLLEDQIISFQNITNEQKEILLRILAYDFGNNYYSILNINDKKFKLSLHFEELEGK